MPGDLQIRPLAPPCPLNPLSIVPAAPDPAHQESTGAHVVKLSVWINKRLEAKLKSAFVLLLLGTKPTKDD
jgi:hypothetical protein